MGASIWFLGPASGPPLCFFAVLRVSVVFRLGYIQLWVHHGLQDVGLMPSTPPGPRTPRLQPGLGPLTGGQVGNQESGQAT